MDATCCYLEPVSLRLVFGDPPGVMTRACDKPAEWVIVHGPAPDDYTHACTAHVGELLTDSPEHRVYPYRQPATQEQT